MAQVNAEMFREGSSLVCVLVVEIFVELTGWIVTILYHAVV